MREIHFCKEANIRSVQRSGIKIPKRILGHRDLKRRPLAPPPSRYAGDEQKLEKVSLSLD
jgi:hypothetical protein